MVHDCRVNPSSEPINPRRVLEERPLFIVPRDGALVKMGSQTHSSEEKRGEVIHTGGKLYLVFGSSFGTITLRWREPKVITNNKGVDTAERDVVMDCKNCNYCKHDPVSYTQMMRYI